MLSTEALDTLERIRLIQCGSVVVPRSISKVQLSGLCEAHLEGVINRMEIEESAKFLTRGYRWDCDDIDEKVEQILMELSMPEIGFPLSPENVRFMSEYLLQDGDEPLKKSSSYTTG